MMTLVAPALAGAIALGSAKTALASPPSTNETSPNEVPPEPPPHMRNCALLGAGVAMTVLGVGGAAGGLALILSGQGQRYPIGLQRGIAGAPLLAFLGPGAIAGPIMIAVGASKTTKRDTSSFAPSPSVAVGVEAGGLIVRGTF